MNNNEHDNKLEQRIRFVAKRYREGSLDPVSYTHLTLPTT